MSAPLTRSLTAVLRERAMSMWLANIVDAESLRLAEREQRLAIVLTGLGLGELTDEDQGCLRALLPRLPAGFRPLAAMIEHSLNMTAPGT